nr:hypothetical protein [Tanacetum cinerariifolium]
MQLWDKCIINFKEINEVILQTTLLEVVLLYRVLYYYEVTPPYSIPLRHAFLGVLHEEHRLGHCKRPISVSPLFFRHAKGRKSGARLSEGYFIRRLTAHFDLAQHLCEASRYMGLGSPETREVAGCCGWAPKDAEGAHEEVDGDQSVSAPVQAPQPPSPTPARTVAQRLSVLDRGEQKGVLDSMACDFSRFTIWTVTSISHIERGQDAIRRIRGFGIRRTDYLYRPCCKEIDKLVMVYSGKRRQMYLIGVELSQDSTSCLKVRWRFSLLLAPPWTNEFRVESSSRLGFRIVKGVFGFNWNFRFQLDLGNVKDKILVPKPPKNCARCAKCGHPIIFESSDDSTNVVNAPREPVVVKQDHESFVNKIIHTFSSNQHHCFHCKDVLRDGETCQRCTCTRCRSGLSKGLCYICGNNQNSSNDSPSISGNSSQNPPHIDKCCCECGEALDGIFCQQCTCKSCGKGAHIGYKCPQKVLIISNPEPCNQTMNNELPQTLPSFDSMCNSDKRNSVPCVLKPNFVDESSKIFNPPPQPPIYFCKFYGSNALYGHYCTPQAPFINPEPGYSQDFNFP